VTIEEIKTVCFVGGGTMGCFNALLAGIAGYEALVWDHSPETLGGLPERLKEFGDFLVQKALINSDQLAAGLPRIHPVDNPQQASARADLLSESVFERLDLKRQVHEHFDRLCPAHTIMTTNTSNLLLSRIESAVSRGDRFAALHSHLGSGLFDIVGGPRTSKKTIDILTRYVRSLGGIPLILRKERPGYLYNAMFGPILGRALMLLIEGRANLQDIDRAWMTGRNTEAGPFAMMDFIGLNVILDSSTENLSDPTRAEHARKVIQLLSPMVERGELGVKTGKGFYTYPDPAFAQPDFRAGKAFREPLYDALFSGLAVTALLLVIDEYATAHDVDRAWMAAQHDEMGPLGMLDQRGLDVFAAQLEDPDILGPVLPEDKLRIQAFLGTYLDRGHLGAKSGRGFYDYPEAAYKNPGFLYREPAEGRPA
jgi:enoyl-CoA hydratase / 3-hydroxyacyl-CoA dehydrogenase